jgi:hypothetical protein
MVEGREAAMLFGGSGKEPAKGAETEKQLAKKREGGYSSSWVS